MMSPIDDKKVKDFQKKILDWWQENRREFPWRKTTDPYKIMVSEFMLQQTQANRVVEKYTDFLKMFPTLEILAKSDSSKVLKIWSGLGYNRRALWLQEAAQKIYSIGFFPKTPETLKKLKGIGEYSSRSILIFAFNSNLAAVDTNIRRILIAEGFADQETTDKALLKIASHLVPKQQSKDWHNALMDYGATYMTALKTGIKPKTSQPKFEGSNRQIRGIILKFIIEAQQATKSNLLTTLEIPEKKLEKSLQSLIKDKLIIIEGEIIKLP